MSNIIPSEAQKQRYKYSSPQNKNTVIIYLPLTLKTCMTFLCLWNKKVFFLKSILVFTKLFKKKENWDCQSPEK